jgi:hypothetical protein
MVVLMSDVMTQLLRAWIELGAASMKFTLSVCTAMKGDGKKQKSGIPGGGSSDAWVGDCQEAAVGLGKVMVQVRVPTPNTPKVTIAQLVPGQPALRRPVQAAPAPILTDRRNGNWEVDISHLPAGTYVGGLENDAGAQLAVFVVYLDSFQRTT